MIQPKLGQITLGPITFLSHHISITSFHFTRPFSIHLGQPTVAKYSSGGGFRCASWQAATSLVPKRLWTPTTRASEGQVSRTWRVTSVGAVGDVTCRNKWLLEPVGSNLELKFMPVQWRFETSCPRPDHVFIPSATTHPNCLIYFGWFGFNISILILGLICKFVLSDWLNILHLLVKPNYLSAAPPSAFDTSVAREPRHFAWHGDILARCSKKPTANLWAAA